jgi:hypothetical protein
MQSYNSALWRKLRRWMSLLLQLVFLALVTFALTQPLAPWQTAQPASTVFVLDPSASMLTKEGSGTRWERALEVLEQRIRQLRPFDRAAILVATDPPQVLSGWTASRRTLLDALAQARPVEEGVSLRAALALAENLQATQPNASVQLLTDGVWKDPTEVGEKVECVWIGEPQPNAGITQFSARRSFSSPGEVRVSLEVTSRARDKVDGAVELFRSGQLVDVQPVPLEPGGVWQREWDLQASGADEFEAKLTGFPPDALGADDSARVKIDAVHAVKVILVSDPNPYLEAALAALPLVEWARVEKLSGYPDPNALYVFNRIAPPEGFENANTILINPLASGFWGQSAGAVDRPLVSEVAKDEPLMRHTGFANVSLDAAAKWQKPPVSQVFAESFGEPLIYGQWDDRRRWALLAFDLEGSDFVLRTAFPILLGNAVESLRPSKTVAPSTAPGRGESALEVTALKEKHAPTASPGLVAWWFAFPLWWWALAAAALWLVGEWWLFTRRVTE